MKKRPKKDRNSYAALKKEITNSLIVFGGLLAIAGAVDLIWLEDNPIHFWGIDRSIRWGVPTLFVAACLVICGIAFATSPRIMFATIGSAACLLTALLHFLYFFHLPERYANLVISIVVAGVAAMLWIRSRELINAEIRAQGEERLKRELYEEFYKDPGGPVD